MHSAVKIIAGLVLISGVGVGVYFAVTNDHNTDSEDTTTYTYLSTTVVTTNPNTCQNHTHCDVCESFWFSSAKKITVFVFFTFLHKVNLEFKRLNIQDLIEYSGTLL